MKMFRVCRVCVDNLNTINYPSKKLAKDTNKLVKCPMVPTCAGQPSRIKKLEVGDIRYFYADVAEVITGFNPDGSAIWTHINSNASD